MGLVAPRHVGSSRTIARTRVPWIGRQTLKPLRHQGSPTILFFFFFLINRLLLFFFFLSICFIYLFMVVLGLRFCARAFSSCGKRGPLFIAVRRPFIVTASLLRGTRSRRAGSVTVAHGPSCSATCGIFPDQGSNPCPLHWQADSQPLRHQGSPHHSFLMTHLWTRYDWF